MKSEILIEVENNLKKMERLIEKQLFTIEDAKKFLTRYFNVYRKIEDLIISRDNWKNKYMVLKNEKDEDEHKKVKTKLTELGYMD